MIGNPTGNPSTTTAGIGPEAFGTLSDGRQVDRFTLSNRTGMQVTILTLGGIISSLTVPDRHGETADVVLGFDSLEPYLAPHSYFGAIIGRYCNRISDASFTLDGRRVELAKNHGRHHLHGGFSGFDKALWRVHTNPSAERLQLEHRSHADDQGFPGTLDVDVTYSLTNRNELRIDYRATTTAATPINLTNHSFFNLAGEGRANILGHLVEINADRFTPVTAELIPTGELREVAGTAFDFRNPYAIGLRIDDDDEQLRFAIGYDHNFVLTPSGETSRFAARAWHPESGRCLEIFTNEPGIQLYTANFLDGSLTGKRGIAYQRRSAFCLETQHFPDSPNRPEFPSTILRPGESYQSTTVYRFSVRS